MDGRQTDGNRPVIDPIRIMHALSKGQRLLESLIKDNSSRTSILRCQESLLELAQDLTFTDNLGFQADGDPQQMPQGLIPLTKD